MSWLTRAFGGDARAPRSVDSALRAALLALLDRDEDRAEQLLAQAVRMDVDDFDAYLALARLYRTRAETGRAIRVHQNLLLRGDLSPELRLTVLCDLGADFVQGGFWRRAIASFDEVLVLDKRHVGALRALVSLLPRVGELPRAIELARRLGKLERHDSKPAEAELYVKLAESQLAGGENEAARKTARKALHRDRNCVDAWLVLGALEAERGKSKAALAAWSQVPKLDLARGAQVYPRLEATYAALGRAKEFEGFLRGLLARDAKDVGTRHALARTLAARGDFVEAVAELRGVIADDADHLETRAVLGRVLLAGDRQREAMREYGELLDALERTGIVGPMEKPE